MESSDHATMYRSCPTLYYEPRVACMYEMRATLKDGRLVTIPYAVENRTPHDFVIHFVIRWLLDPSEIQEISLWKRGAFEWEYLESYIPREGWFKKDK